MADTKVLNSYKKPMGMLGESFNHGVQKSMVLVYEKLANPAAALQLEKEVLEIRTATLGSEHPKTAQAQRIFNRLQPRRCSPRCSMFGPGP